MQDIRIGVLEEQPQALHQLVELASGCHAFFGSPSAYRFLVRWAICLSAHFLVSSIRSGARPRFASHSLLDLT